MYLLKKVFLLKIIERCLKNKKVEKFLFLFFFGDDKWNWLKFFWGNVFKKYLLLEMFLKIIVKFFNIIWK